MADKVAEGRGREWCGWRERRENRGKKEKREGREGKKVSICNPDYITHRDFRKIISVLIPKLYNRLKIDTI